MKERGRERERDCRMAQRKLRCFPRQNKSMDLPSIGLKIQPQYDAFIIQPATNSLSHTDKHTVCYCIVSLFFCCM